MEDAYEKSVRRRAESETRTKLIISCLQLLVGGVLTIGFGTATFFNERNVVAYGLTAALGCAILLAHISADRGWFRIFKYLGYHQKSWTRSGTVARANTYYDDVKSDSKASPTLSSLKSYLFWTQAMRVVIAFTMIGVWVVNGYLSDRAAATNPPATQHDVERNTLSSSPISE